MDRRIPLAAAMPAGALALVALVALLATATPAAVNAAEPSSPPPTQTIPPDPGRPDMLKGGVMMAPPEPKYLTATNPEPAAPPGAWYPIPALGPTGNLARAAFASRTATGRYLVWLTPVSPAGATQVTARGVTCAASEVERSPVTYPGVDISVDCRDGEGRPADTGFALTYVPAG